MRLMDSHCHLDFPDFAADRDQILQQAAAQGIERLIVAAISREHWPRLWQLVEAQPACYGTLGLHPYFLDQHQPDDLLALREELLKRHAQPKFCAIGEIGLDYQIPNADRATQQFYFEKQLELAVEFAVPVIIHVRKAHARVIDILKAVRPPAGGIIHAYNGSLEQAVEYRKLGFFLGIGGAYSWPNARKLRRMLPLLPLEQLVLETDSPDMSPAFAQGQRNTPLNLPRLCQLLADELLDISAEQLARQTSLNLCRLFGWPERAA